MTYKRKNKGVCSLSTQVTLDDQGVVEHIEVTGGCSGNLKGLCSLLSGMNATEAITRLEGLTCGNKPTSCPDQIAQTLREALAQ